MAFWQKTPHFGKFTGFTAFDENHGFHDFLLSLNRMFRHFDISPPVLVVSPLGRFAIQMPRYQDDSPPGRFIT